MERKGQLEKIVARKDGKRERVPRKSRCKWKDQRE